LEVDLKKDSFHITYDPERVDAERMLEAVRVQGFQGEVVNDASRSSSPSKVRCDLARLPEELRKAAQDAKKNGKPLLLAFHGPG